MIFLTFNFAPNHKILHKSVSPLRIFLVQKKAPEGAFMLTFSVWTIFQAADLLRN